jgi:hypothetical protein
MTISYESSSTPPECTSFGSVTGDPASAFSCASGFDASTAAAFWTVLVFCLFVILWIRLVYKAWNIKFKGNYNWDEVGKIALIPGVYLCILIAILTWY